MQISLFKRIRKFFRTTLIGGLAAILPLTLVVIFFRWILNLIEKYLGPIVKIVDTDSRLYTFALYVITIVAILLLFFVIGVIIRTRIGQFLNRAEDKYLFKIPGYKLAKETVQQFFGKNKSFFKEVVLVDPFNTGTLMTGFITDDMGDVITVFVPTGPNPTSGNILHLSSDKVFRTGASVDMGMKSIISCGAGTSNIFKNVLGREIGNG
ncbi:MAG: DUF502 domain-containing protein [Bacteroidales bacterium]|nr:DUF502 domain-containing protein [Bacteroidales bacterium]MBN2699046.1 DUF502 domain-containing protein [Bacteroidales bacterium]